VAMLHGAGRRRPTNDPLGVLNPCVGHGPREAPTDRWPRIGPPHGDDPPVNSQEVALPPSADGQSLLIRSPDGIARWTGASRR